MNCMQCEQTVKPGGCGKVGVCTKTPQMAALQDLILFGCAQKPKLPRYRVLQLIFTTLTNVNHNLTALENACAELLPFGDAEFKLHYTRLTKEKQFDASLSPLHYRKLYGADLNALVQLGFQGIKGAAAYAEHVYRITEKMGVVDKDLESVADQLVEHLHYFTFQAKMETALDRLMLLGKTNFKAIELLDQFNFKFNGEPELVAVPTKLVPGKCVLVTGHDMVDMKTLLEVCEKEGVNVYTHGEMLPTYMYPNLRKHKNLIGNFGHAW